MFQSLSVKPYSGSRCVYCTSFKPQNATSLLYCPEQFSWFYKQNSINVTYRFQKHQHCQSFFQTAAPRPSASTPKESHSRAGHIPHLEHGSPGLTYQPQTQSPRKLLWQNTSCCRWISAMHTGPQPVNTQPSTGRHRGNTTAALQLKSFLGPPDIDMLTVWVVFLPSISATGSHSQLSCIYSLGFTLCSLPNVPNFKELQVY